MMIDDDACMERIGRPNRSRGKENDSPPPPLHIQRKVLTHTKTRGVVGLFWSFDDGGEIIALVYFFRFVPETNATEVGIAAGNRP